MKKRNKLSRGTIAISIFLICMFVIFMVPFFWLAVSSFRPNEELFTKPFGMPNSLSWDNYLSVFKSHPMLLYFGNTVFVALLATLIVTIVSLLASYAFMYDFPKASKVAAFLAIGLFIPTNAFLVPYYVMTTKIGLYNSLLGIVLVYAGVNLPQGLMIIKGYMSSIPKTILEAASIDGASTNMVLTRIVVPMSVPGVVTSCIFVIINCWNELLFANLLSQSDVSRTIQVAIRSFLTTFNANYAHAFAAMVISIFPTIIIYAFLTDKIIGGMTAGAVKE